MWITLLLMTAVCFSTAKSHYRCENVFKSCYMNPTNWTRCYEERITNCKSRLRISGFVHMRVNSSQEAEASPTLLHRVRVPSSALQRSRVAESEEEVVLVASIFNSSYFKVRHHQGKGRSFPQPADLQGDVLGGLVLAVKVGGQPVTNLSQAIKLTFKHNQNVEKRTCVFWVDSPVGTGHWSTEGCDTSETASDCICTCNHLSFFAVLVNPLLSVDKKTAVTLSYITYIGSALSVVLTLISLIIYMCLHRRRPEKSISIHMQLTGALLLLHLGFLLSSFWVRMQKEGKDSWVCEGLGFFLHWSLLATLSWTALEGFHLYLLLVRVFNIYIRRYILKLSLLGWGLPTLVTVICEIAGVYGIHKVNVTDASNYTSEARVCWLSNQFPHMDIVSYSTTAAFPCLVVLYNTCMLVLVVFKLWRLRGGGRSFESVSDWRKIYKEKGGRLRKDCMTVLGLSCVLGLPWGLATTTYVSTPGIYAFTILNSLQGVFVFLWSVALTCKSRSENNSSSRDTYSQKIMMTSLKS